MKLSLYRGDSRYNSFTNPEICEDFGITTQYDFDADLLNCCSGIHKILANETLERTRNLITGECRDYGSLSFTTSKQTAEYWMREKNKVDLAKSYCDQVGDHYLFTLRLDLAKGKYIGHGIYRVKYHCQHNNCQTCKGGDYHLMIVINYSKHLKTRRDFIDYQIVYANAVKSREWIVIPVDRITAFNLPFHIIFKSVNWSVDVYDDLADEDSFWR